MILKDSTPLFRLHSNLHHTETLMKAKRMNLHHLSLQLMVNQILLMVHFYSSFKF